MAEELKSEVVREICSISSAFAGCAHLRRSPRKPAFVDWYLILRVDEDAGEEVIRRQYRQLALQLHPDKNKHPKAEVAFKLISEAYECLVDKARRRAFNSERRNSFCKECHRKLQSSSFKSNGDTERQRGYNAPEQPKSVRAPQAKKEARNRFREECRVIESCLRANGAAGESPLFDPCDCQLFPDYPHNRARVFERSRDYFWYFNGGGSVRGQRGLRGVRCESPIYQIRSENRRNRS